MNKNYILIGGAVVLLLIIGVVLSTQRDTQPAEMSPQPTSMENSMMESAMPEGSASGDSMVQGITSEDGVTTVTMEAGAFYYSVEEIRVKQGDTVRIVMTSKDMMHDFTIDELDVKSEVARAGETITVEFTADKVGEFEYYCSVGQHRSQGQVGTIVVEA